MLSVISIDIGSTYTKGALFVYQDAEKLRQFRVVSQATTPTTVSHLPDGFHNVLGQLLKHCDASDQLSIRFSSSAKGGLSIAALGIVPELTLKSAKLTALSAGGRVDNVLAYKITRHDLAALEQAPPDIILLAGGTDGGNEAYVMHNASLLAKSTILAQHSALVYAGNQVLAEDIEQMFTERGFDVRLSDNILPEIDKMAPDSARARIREVFLQRIIKGRGLDELVKEVGHQPNPTPYAVLSLVESIARRAPEFGDFLVVDLGGATTDVYSSCPDCGGAERVVYRGLREPAVKRTVEGDLGMRVSVKSAALAMDEPMAAQPDFQDYVSRVYGQTSYIAQTSQEEAFDRALAASCVAAAVKRHAGTHRRVFTAMGEVFVQSGKDLRNVKRLIGSGGYLSRSADFCLSGQVFGAVDPNAEVLPLVPTNANYCRDDRYLWPLLGNLAADFEELSVATAIGSLDNNPGTLN